MASSGDKRKLRIAFDARAAARPNKAGVGYYASSVIQALNDHYGDRVELVGHYYQSAGQPDLAPPIGKAISYRVSRILPEKLVNLLRRMHIEIPFEFLVGTKADVFFFPDFLTHPSSHHTPTVVTIHDTAYLAMPETVSPRNRDDLTRFVPASIHRAQIVTTISNATREQLIEAYRTDKPIVVTHLAPTVPAKDPRGLQRLAEINLHGRFILFTGTLEPRKNIEGLIKAYRALPDNLRQEYSLVLAGGSGWNNQGIEKAIEKARAAGEHVITPGYVDAPLRQALFEAATLFVWPSFNEGFGMPPLEAMAAGTPVLVSDIPVLKEVCGTAAAYCDPHDPKDIAKHMQKLLQDSGARKRLSAEGAKHARQFSWEKVAQVLFESFQAAAKK